MVPIRAWLLLLNASYFVVLSSSTQLGWDQVQPIGCVKGDEGKGRWCEVHDDGSVTLRNVKILKDKIHTGDKKLALGKGYEGMESDITCANSVLRASEEADTKYQKSEFTRLKGMPADLKRQRLPSQYRCRKNPKLKEGIGYHCTVTDYKMQSKAGKEGSIDSPKESAGSLVVSDVDRCKELVAWQAKFQADKTEGKDAFWKFLAKSHEGFAELEKLKTHSVRYGTGTGKMLAAIETKTTKTYKKISKELHPDKQVKLFRSVPECNTNKDSLLEMLKQTFDRAADLKRCILKPLRCEVPEFDTPGHRNNEL